MTEAERIEVCECRPTHLPGGRAGGGCYMAGPGNKPNRPLVCAPDCPVAHAKAEALREAADEIPKMSHWGVRKWLRDRADQQTSEGSER